MENNQYIETTELREHIHYGYRAYNGKVLCNAHVDTYNRQQDNINAWIIERGYVPEEELNRSHKLFSMFCEAA